MSSMWSASSSTRNLTVARLTSPRCMRSMRRPGVATRMSMPRASVAIWRLIDWPPTTVAILSGVALATGRRLSAIWFTSSRVGASTSAFTDFGAGRPGLSISRCSIGRPKASVLPVPVWARPRMSWPARARGMDWVWMGVGCENPACASSRVRVGARPSRSNSDKTVLSGQRRQGAARRALRCRHRGDTGLRARRTTNLADAFRRARLAGKTLRDGIWEFAGAPDHVSRSGAATHAAAQR